VGALEYFGKVSARLDDVLNFIRRLAALGIVVAAGLVGGMLSARRAMPGITAGPGGLNAGWTMSAMAGALG
jgi:cobalamin biosynthesis protein CobD/CbiB